MSFTDLPLRVSNGALAPITLANNDLIVAFLGDTLTFAFDTVLGTISPTITRAPAGAAATFTAGAITPDRVGLSEYSFAYTSSNTPQNRIRVVVFPTATKGTGNSELRLIQPNRSFANGNPVADPSPRSVPAMMNILTAYLRERARLGEDLTTYDAGLAMPSALNQWLGSPSNGNGANYTSSPWA